MARQRLDDFLLQRGLIDEDQRAAARAYLTERGGRFEAALTATGALSEEALATALGRELKLPVELKPPEGADVAALPLLKAQFCETRQVFPLRLKTPPTGRRTLTLGVTDPLDLATLEEVEFATNCRLQLVVTTPLCIRMAILRHYQHQRIDDHAAGSRMTVIRPGGGEEIIETEGMARQGHAPESDDEGVVALTEEVTSRTELVELISEQENRSAAAATARDLSYLTGEGESGRLDELERKLWSIVRLLASKGILTKEEFLSEFGEP